MIDDLKTPNRASRGKSFCFKARFRSNKNRSSAKLVKNLANHWRFYRAFQQNPFSSAGLTRSFEITGKDQRRKENAEKMKRELGIARCGLACCLCAENENCDGCRAENCHDKEWCENRKCSMEKELDHCFECTQDCRKGLLQKIKPYAFTLFARQYGVEYLLDCLEKNEQNGVVYHREGITGDYDDFDTVEELMEFIKTGKRF